jgi:hypothetical protein
MPDNKITSCGFEERGLPPLPNPTEHIPTSSKDKTATSKPKPAPSQGLSFSSSTKLKAKANGKRKATSQLDDLKSSASESSIGKKEAGTKDSRPKHPAKKAKRENKTLLSFGDDA